MNSILLAKNIDVSKVTFSDNVKTLDNGGKTVYIGYNGQPLYVQTPEMVTPFDSSCWNATGGTDPSKDKHSVDTRLKFTTSHLQNVFTQQTKDLDAKFQQSVNKSRFENYAAAYNALQCKCESKYDFFMNIII